MNKTLIDIINDFISDGEGGASVRHIIKELLDEKDVEIAQLNAAMDEMAAALEGMCNEAVVLSGDYLDAFSDFPVDMEIQGWDKARWIRALDAKKIARAVLAKYHERGK